MQPCVSVIIPVYNIEKHLEKCLDSVIGQTLKNIEIIVVDDGSTDNSPRIIDRYARTDSRIVAIHKANEGLAYARKSGIEAAHGKYVQHLDGDDFLEPDACELLFNRAEETNADIVIMRFLIDSPCVQEEPPFWTQDEYNNISAIHTMAHEDYRWNLVFLFQRRDLHAVPIDYLQNLTYGEDAYQSIQIAYRSKKIVTLRDKPLYHYLENPASATHRYMRDYPAVFARFLERKAEIVEKYGLDATRPQWRANTVWAGLLIAVGNEYVKSNPKPVREKRKAVEALCAQPEFAKAIRELRPKGLGRNKQIVADLIGSGRFGTLTALYRLKNHM